MPKSTNSEEDIPAWVEHTPEELGNWATSVADRMFQEVREDPTKVADDYWAHIPDLSDPKPSWLYDKLKKVTEEFIKSEWRDTDPPNAAHEEPMEAPTEEEFTDSLKTQVGGDHYTRLKIQPLELTLATFGYEAYRGALFTKINKYIMRDKDNYVEQLKKARHCLDMLIEETERRENEEQAST